MNKLTKKIKLKKNPSKLKNYKKALKKVQNNKIV
jgi:hypothetical protein